MSAQVSFVAEFALFLVAVAGLALVVLGASLLARTAAARAAFAVGFAAIGTAAFLHGSLLVAAADTPGTVAARALGIAALTVGSLAWAGGEAARRVLWGGLVAAAAALGLAVAGADEAAAAIEIVAALLVGTALLGASRRSVAARFATSAAATLLLVVLVLGAGLSAVLATSVEDQAVTDLDQRARREAAAIEAQAGELPRETGVVARTLAELRETPGGEQPGPRLLPNLPPDGVPSPVARQTIVDVLTGSSTDLFQGVGFAYVAQSGATVATSGATLPAQIADALGTSRAVTEALASRQGRQSVEVLGGRPVVLGVTPLSVRGTDGAVRPVGAVVGVTVLDEQYLAGRAGADGSLALVGPGGTLATAGPHADEPRGRDLATDVLSGSTRAVDVTDDLLLAARPVRGADGAPLLAVVTARPATAVDDARESLFRTLFVIAFGGSILALLLAAIAGDRIGAGLRRLTLSARAIQQGDLSARAGITSDDEVGVLGATFDSMAASIEVQTAALSRAAADEARLRNRLEAVVAGVGEALVAVDEDGRVTDYNPAAETLLSRPVADALGRPVAEVVELRSEDGADLRPRLRATGARWSGLGSVRSAGSDVPVAVTAGPLRGPGGEVAGAVFALRDLRGEREVERMKREFLSRVGHELRTPLTPLIGYAQLLTNREVPLERARDLHEAMLASAKRLERIVEMLEFFASLEAGRQVVDLVPVDVRTVVDGVVGRRAAALDGKAAITRRVARGTPTVLADAYWLGRAIDELVDNAVKFSPGTPRVAVTAGPVDVDGRVFTEIAVKDGGSGMSPDQVERAFTEWVQGDESDTRAHGGLGLGLALVQRVAERHGGLVRCETAPGKGSRISMLIPAAAARSDRAGRRPGGVTGATLAGS